MSFKVIGVGEVLWDELPAGPQLGGAPANFACHAKQLGASAQIVTRVGNDALGREILQRFVELGIADGTVQEDDELPTGTAGVVLNHDGVPHFVIREHAAWDHLALTGKAQIAVQTANAICFGTLAQRKPAAATVIQQLVAATPPAALRVFDVNLRQEFYARAVVEQSLHLANVLKLNDHELAVLAGLFDLTGSAHQQVEMLAARFELLLVALTRGDKGSLLFQAGHWSDLPGRAVQIVDTVGAGDSFTAALVMGLLHGLALEQIHRVAADVADFVCSRPGATPALPDLFRVKFISESSSLASVAADPT